jgi:hypothetical protein
MPTLSVTVSLRKDEVEALTKLMEKYGMRRHEVIKFALRSFLFPTESTVPLDGRHLHRLGTGHYLGPVQGNMDSETIKKSILKTEEQKKVILKRE